MKPTLDWNAYLETAAQAVSEGIVMLKNENRVLPLKNGSNVAVFGRMQLHYYKSGTGSGGMVNVHHVVGINEGLQNAGIHLNAMLLNEYTQWDSEHPIVQAEGWGGEAWSQAEMPLSEATAKKAAAESEYAICIIGRTAGEEQDNFDGEGSYRLYREEAEMLKTVRRHFSKMIVLLNVGNLMDMEEIETVCPDAILYVWHGGMTGGTGTAKVLTGEISPSGKLPDTIAYTLADYPSDANFGNPERNFYTEDIYVGYRYFETFAKEKVRYPFGFGLSYTTFALETVSTKLSEGIVSIQTKVTNTGEYSGKEVVQVYCEAPQGKLGKPSRILCGFQKTKCLSPNESEFITISFDLDTVASFDDKGATDFQFSEILEKGDYHFYIGTDVRSASECFVENVIKDMPRRICHSALAPVLPFQRIKPQVSEQGITISYEPVPQRTYNESERILSALPKEFPYTGNKGIQLKDVRDGKSSMEDFIAQLSKEELCWIIRGEGMGSPKCTAGTAAVFGGITTELKSYGIPCSCCDDGPSGLRLDSGVKAFSLPIGTLLAATFNPDLSEKLFEFTGLEMRTNQIDILLGPGMNIHRHPRNGRNFEYFSEDPLLTGKMGAAVLRGLQKAGVTGTIKHFCGNNQETNRRFCDNCMSERALREIYLKGFEIAVREGNADSIMTTYGLVNGTWTSMSYDLNTVILRDEWNYTGFTMTDWWANLGMKNGQPYMPDYAAIVRAQNDIYMVCADTKKDESNLSESLENGTLSIGELQRSAMNLCRFLMKSSAMRRMLGEDDTPAIIGKPNDSEELDRPIPFYPMSPDVSIPVSSISTEDGKRNNFVLGPTKVGVFEFSVTASSKTDAKLTLYVLGSHCATFHWKAGNQSVTYSKELMMFSPFVISKLYIYGDIQPENITIRYLREQPTP